jgi:acyl-CoA synthetase (AMP-forming)/AMP-acid ligase II
MRDDRRADGPAYLLCSAGWTVSASGVVLTYANLMDHLGTVHRACGYGNGVTVTWMPHFHDYGLVQGLLQPFFSGDPCYFMSPLSFMKRPSQWLHAISRFGGTHRKLRTLPTTIASDAFARKRGRG